MATLLYTGLPLTRTKSLLSGLSRLTKHHLIFRNKDGRTFLANTAALHKAELLRLALEHDTNINGRNAWGKTPLLEAVTATIEGEDRERADPLEKITDLLLGAGADPSIADDYGELPMQTVASYRSAAVLQQFIALGSSTIVTDEHGDYTNKARNVLHLAARRSSDPEKLRMLLELNWD